MSSSRKPASLPRRPIQLNSFAPVSPTMKLPDVESEYDGYSPRQGDHAYPHASYITPPPSPQYPRREIDNERRTNSPRQYLNTPSQQHTYSYSPSSSSTSSASFRSPSKLPQLLSPNEKQHSHHYYSSSPSDKRDSQRDPRLASSASKDYPPYAPCTFYAPLPPITDSYSYPSPPHRSSNLS